jgi:DNA-binding NarL/FixJ family response regulator
VDDESGPGSYDPVVPTGRSARIRVVVVDDHAMLRAGTKQILDESGDMEVVGEAENAAEALSVISSSLPDVVLMDIKLPDRNGIDIAAEIVADFPSITVLMVSAYDDEDYVRAALDVGVAGYLLKTMPGEEIVQAVRAARSGITVLDPAVSARLRNKTQQAEDSRDGLNDNPGSLSWREQQVVDLVAEGLANKAIAGRLGISTRTVEGHLNHVFAKLGIFSRTELVRHVLNNERQQRLK